MMNKKRILLILLLTIFITGICINTVSAAHIIKVGKYKAKLTDKQYNYLKKVEKRNGNADVTLKTGKYYHYKKPVYKKKKVTTKKWVYKKVLKSKYVYKSKNEDYTEHKYSTAKYDKSWKWYGSYSIDKDYEWGWESKHYYKYKKKVKVTKIKKVKIGYKKAKDPIYITVSVNNGKGLNPKGVFMDVWCSEWGKEKSIVKYRAKL